MTDLRDDPVPGWSRATELLRARGAAEMDHPGGTLLAHLDRVGRTLAAWGADPDVCLAGLCHAVYGTDGIDLVLMDHLTERSLLASLIGERAEALVYLYGSCDRDATYAQLGAAPSVVFRDRFTGAERVPDEADVRAFVEITVVNELDVMAHNAELAARYGPALHGLFTRSRELMSATARAAFQEQLGPHAPTGIDIEGLDHLVLTVADIDRTVEFYERVLGMRAVTFGAGRRALAFGRSKINLHRAGHEFAPHAARPTPGSADLCLVTATPQERVAEHLAACGVTVEEGPVPRTGALGPFTSTYLRDPDDNLIEISTYDLAPPGGGGS